VTAGARAATIRACRCGVARTVGHPRPRRPGAGSVVDPAPLARPVGTSAGRSPPSSVTAVSTLSGDRSGATRSGPAGKRRRPRSRLPRRPMRRPHGDGRSRPSTWSRTEPLFDGSSSSRCLRPHRTHDDGRPSRRAAVTSTGRRAIARHPTATEPADLPTTRRRSAGSRPRPAPRSTRRSRMPRRARSPAIRPNRPGACGATPTSDGRGPTDRLTSGLLRRARPERHLEGHVLAVAQDVHADRVAR